MAPKGKFMISELMNNGIDLAMCPYASFFNAKTVRF